MDRSDQPLGADDSRSPITDPDCCESPDLLVFERPPGSPLLHSTRYPPRRHPASFDASAIMRWRSQSLSSEGSRSPSLRSSPTTSSTAVALTESPTASYSVALTPVSKNKAKRLAGSAPFLSDSDDGDAVVVQPLLWTSRTSSGRTGAIHLVGCENPYAELGRLEFNPLHLDATRWRPYNPACTVPPFFATLRAGLETRPSSRDEPVPLQVPVRRTSNWLQNRPLPWLERKTVVLVGDDVERAHARDFCRLAGGQYAVIDPAHPLSPRPFRNGIDEKWLSTEANALNDTRPTVCYLPGWDFALVTIFHYGLAHRVEFEHEVLLADPHYYPPAALHDRLDHILLPLLDRLGRPRPDFIEFASGFWDLRHFAALDRRAGQPLSGELSTERLVWYLQRLVQAFSELSILFPSTRINWRPLYDAPEYDWAHPVRSAALERLARQTIKALNKAQDVATAEQALLRALGAPARPGRAGRARPNGPRRSDRTSVRPQRRSITKAGFLNQVKERIGSSDRVQDRELSGHADLRGLLSVSEWSSVMRGRDMLATPGGYVWGDMMLYELWRTAEREERRANPG